jgi:hypothetical protein
LLQLGSMVLLQQLLTMGSLISISSCSQAVFARQLQRAGLYQNLPVLMQAAAAHLDSIQDSDTLLLAAKCSCGVCTHESVAADDSLASVFALLLHVDNTINVVIRSVHLKQQPDREPAFNYPALQLSLSVMRFVSRCVDQLPAQHPDAPIMLLQLWERAFRLAASVISHAYNAACTATASSMTSALLPRGSGAASHFGTVGDCFTSAAASEAPEALSAMCMFTLHTLCSAPTAAKLTTAAAAAAGSSATTVDLRLPVAAGFESNPTFVLRYFFGVLPALSASQHSPFSLGVCLQTPLAPSPATAEAAAPVGLQQQGAGV